MIKDTNVVLNSELFMAPSRRCVYDGRSGTPVWSHWLLPVNDDTRDVMSESGKVESNY